MKQTTNLRIIFLTIACLALAFTSCSDDDDHGLPQELIGTWECDTVQGDTRYYASIEFDSRGNYKEKQITYKHEESSSAWTVDSTSLYTDKYSAKRNGDGTYNVVLQRSKNYGSTIGVVYSINSNIMYALLFDWQKSAVRFTRTLSGL